MHYAFLFFLCLLWQTHRTQATGCARQFYNYFISEGLPNSTVQQPVILFATGVLLGVPFVKITLQFQDVGQAYENLINATLAPSTFVSYVSVDIPFCVTNIEVDCADSERTGLFKNIQCPIVDFDEGGTSFLVGRIYIYANQTLPCGGTVVLTYYNVKLNALNLSTNIIYDMYGVTNFTLLDPVSAQQQYQFSTCEYSDGSNVSFALQQRQYACITSALECNTTRPPGPSQVVPVPVPQFSCYFSNASFSFVVWWVFSFQAPDGFYGAYGGTFRDPSVSGALLAAQRLFDPQAFDPNILVPQSRTQWVAYNVPITENFDLHYDGQWTLLQPQYSRSNDLLVGQIPCICNFSMDCNAAGEPYNQSQVPSAYIFINNVLPIPDPGPNLMLPLTTPFFELNATLSYDPDHGPFPLSYYWAFYGAFGVASGRMVINITDPTSPLINISSGDLQPGTFIFILYVSDGQAVTFVSFNVTILPNQVQAIVVDDFTVELIPCTLSLRSVCIPLGGNFTYQSNPNMTLFYNWTQTIGFPLLPPQTSPTCEPTDYVQGFFNTTQPNACFIPPIVGIYGFNLTVTDGVSVSWQELFVTVIPARFHDVQPPIALPNFTDPPPRTIPPSSEPNLTFPSPPTVPITEPPFGPPPEFNTTVPGNFDTLPPLTTTQQLIVGGLILLSLLIFVIFIGIYIAMMKENEHNYMDRIRQFYQ